MLRNYRCLKMPCWCLQPALPTTHLDLLPTLAVSGSKPLLRPHLPERYLIKVLDLVLRNSGWREYSLPMTLQTTWTHSRPTGSSTVHRCHEQHSPSFSWSAGCRYVAVYRRGCWRHLAPHRCRLVRSAESIRTVRLRVGPARRRKQLSIQYLGQDAGLRGLSSGGAVVCDVTSIWRGNVSHRIKICGVLCMAYFTTEQNSAVGIYRDDATGWTNWGSNPNNGKIYFSYPHRQDRFWGPPGLLFNRFGVFFPPQRGKVAGA